MNRHCRFYQVLILDFYFDWCRPGLPVTSDNYSKARQILKEQFGSDELIIQHHVKSSINGYRVCLGSLYGPITARSDMREYLMQMAESLKSKDLFTDIREMNEDYNKERSIINKVIADSIIQIKKNPPQLDQQQYALKDDVDHHDNADDFNEAHVGEANPESNSEKQLMTERSSNQNINEQCVESSADPQTQRSVESASSIYDPSLVYLTPFVIRAKTDSVIVAERTSLAGCSFVANSKVAPLNSV
ncbi:hypothetical protein T07_6221 [Trichinella nelsoni]|uniref:Uncharacterized protein n=1 Tax=Trichinella nelsoni TaxID=6336 RepID=A0A0V0SGS5_9BILA|nr:hypothetical protein T07_6221 [Trichinella nelsoni]